jgi:dTDP-4-amino-4,6-dideoxygalactose transaminase
MVMFNDEKLRNKALMYRDWGRIGNNSEDMSERFGHKVDGIEYDFKFLYGVKGYNFKACEMNAAFGLVQMQKLPAQLVVRRANVDRYVQNLKKANTNYLLPIDHNKYEWLAFPLMYKNRGPLLRYLEDQNVQIRVLFSGNITRHPCYRQYLNEMDFPIADRVMAEGFLIGAHQGLNFDDVDRVCELLVKFDRNDLSPVPRSIAVTDAVTLAKAARDADIKSGASRLPYVPSAANAPKSDMLAQYKVGGVADGGPRKVWYSPNMFDAYGEEEILAVEECLREGWLAPGPRTDKFEKEVSAYFKKKCGLMVNSGSSANMVGLAVYDLPQGSEIVTPACTFSTCIAPMEQLGLKPVFIDVEPGRYVPSVQQILAAVTPATRVSLLGFFSMATIILIFEIFL